jgi:glycosyltransferase involved in cell wall biosynthesis
LNACIVSFGPIESEANGYFVRVWNVLKEASRFYSKVVVLEFPEEKVRQIRKIKNITFVRLHGNELISNKFSDFFKKVLTFDPLHGLKFQIFSLFELWKYRKFISSMDIVIVEGSSFPMANVLAKLLKKRVVLDTHGINRLLAMHYRKRRVSVYFFRTLFWAVLERLTTKFSDIVIVVSEKERNFVVGEYGVAESKVFIVPNVVEAPKSATKEDVARALRKSLGLEDKIIVSFVGNLEVVQNADAVEFITNELASQFWKKRKDVAFLIIGKTKKAPKCNLPNVIFTGFVEDLTSYLSISDICIAPLRVGCGVKTKMLDYLIHGRPIVTTIIGAEGLDALVSNLPQNFVKIVSLDNFYETLLGTLSDLHKLNSNKVEIDPQTLLQNFRRNLNEVLYHATEI